MSTGTANSLIQRPPLIKPVEGLLGLMVMCIGLLLVFKVGYLPGDLGDARFNMYILEHAHRWLLRLDTSFWNAPIFYPASNTVALSDNHLGTFLFYSIFRLLGASRELAFQWWAITLCLLDFWSAWIILKRFRLHPIAAIGGAYLFTFAYAVVAQIAHIQLVPRFMVPVAFWMATVFLKSGQIKDLALFLAACAYQFYIGFYMGYFLVLMLIPYGLTLIIRQKPWRPFLSISSKANQVTILVSIQDKREMARRGMGYLICGIAFIVLLLPLAIPYLKAQAAVGSRPWSEVSEMLPRLYSYLYAPRSNFWTGRKFEMPGVYPAEHQLFLGMLPLAALIVFPILLRTNRILGQGVGLAMIWTVLAMVAITLSDGRHSLYWFIWSYFPGGGGIRAVTRIIVDLLYPIAFVFGAALTLVLQKIERRWGWAVSAVVGCVAIGLLVVDQSTRLMAFSFESSQNRIADLRAKIGQAARGELEKKVLWVNAAADEPFFIKQLDAMLAGQELGLSVVNGYSGNRPKQYPLSLWLLDGQDCDALAQWAEIHPGKINRENLIQVGGVCEGVGR
jgi:hypothetical protein